MILATCRALERLGAIERRGAAGATLEAFPPEVPIVIVACAPGSRPTTAMRRDPFPRDRRNVAESTPGRES